MKFSSNNEVVIFGAGMAGAMLAKALCSDLRVTLVDANDYFEVPMAAPRALVHPEFAHQSVMRLADALPDVRHIRGRLIAMRDKFGIVESHDMGEVELGGRVNVLATGSRFSNQLMRSVDSTSAERQALYEQYGKDIAAAQRILIVGGGPIGVEVAGEICETHPAKSITILEAGERILSGTSVKAAAHAHQVLTSSRVTVITGERLASSGSNPSDVFTASGEAITDTGRKIAYDMIIWCVGGKPNTGYMQGELSSKLDDQGRIRVTPNLRVVGTESLFALGDITDLKENKMALHIAGQVKTAAANIRKILSGKYDASKLEKYKAQTGNPMMAVTLGSRRGVLHLPGLGVVRSPWMNRKAKAGHMLVPKYRKILGF